MSAACATRIPMIARPGSAGRLDRLDASPSRRRRRVGCGGRRRCPGGRRRTQRRSCSESGSSCPPAPTMTSPASSTFAAGASVATLSTSAPRGAAFTSYPPALSATAAATSLRARHLAEAFCPPVLEGRSRAGRPRLAARAWRRRAAVNGQQPLDPGAPSGPRRRRSRCAPVSRRPVLALRPSPWRRRAWRCSGRRGSRGTEKNQRERRRAPRPRRRRAPEEHGEPAVVVTLGRARSACRRRPARPCR